MKQLTLMRAFTPMGTFSELLGTQNEHVCYTVERSWENNKSSISCIPNGMYNVSRHTSPKFGDTWILQGGTVEKYNNNNGSRWGILIHKANYPSQLQGCIAPVTKFVPIHNEWGGSSSGSALRTLNTYLGDVEEWELEIITDIRGGNDKR